MKQAALTKEGEGLFIMRPLSFFKGFTRSASKIRALLFSAGKKKQFSGGYATIRDTVRTSRSSIWRAISQEKIENDTCFNLERRGGENGIYTYIGPSEKQFFVRTELWFYAEKFDIYPEGKKSEQKEKVNRLLTDAEIDVLSLIYTFTRHEGTRQFEGDYADIARILGLNYYTVRRAVKALFSARLISRPKKPVNHKEKSVYVASMDLIRRKNRQEYKKHLQKQEKANTGYRGEGGLTIEQINAKIDRERWYSARREESLRKAEENSKKAEVLPRYRELTSALSMMEIEYAKAETFAPLTLPSLKAKRVLLRVERTELLRSIGLTEADLQPRFHCEKCEDTGFLPNGTACDCYQRSKGGGT